MTKRKKRKRIPEALITANPAFNPLALEEYQGVPELSSVHKKMSCSMDRLDPEDKRNPDYRTLMGRFYEALVHSIYGGEWMKNIDVEGDKGYMSRPDIMIPDRDMIIESTSTAWRQHVGFADYHVDKCLLMQIDPALPNKIYFAIFKHYINFPTKYFSQIKGAQEDKFSPEMAKRVAFMLFLPLSIVMNIHDPEKMVDQRTIGEGGQWQANPFKSRYTNYEEESLYDSVTRFSGEAIKKMLKDPGEVLEPFGISLDDYVIERALSPKNIKINNCKVKSFPILMMHDKDHEAWFDSFLEDKRELLEELGKGRYSRAGYSRELIREHIGRSKGREGLSRSPEIDPDYDPSTDGCNDEMNDFLPLGIQEETDIPF